MDPLLAANAIPRLADLAMRRALLAALVRSGRPQLGPIATQALADFERRVERKMRGNPRPALLFTQRNRIVRGLKAFLSSRGAARLFALPRRALVATGAAAGPFDTIVRGSDGRLHAVIFRSAPNDTRRLELYRRIHAAAAKAGGPAVATVTLYNLDGGPARTLPVGRAVVVRAA
jgi:hypothetical protein